MIGLNSNNKNNIEDLFCLSKRQWYKNKCNEIMIAFI